MKKNPTVIYVLATQQPVAVFFKADVADEALRQGQQTGEQVFPTAVTTAQQYRRTVKAAALRALAPEVRQALGLDRVKKTRTPKTTAVVQ